MNFFDSQAHSVQGSAPPCEFLRKNKAKTLQHFQLLHSLTFFLIDNPVSCHSDLYQSVGHIFA